MNACIISSGVCGSKLQQGHRKHPRKREKKRGKRGEGGKKGEKGRKRGRKGGKMGEGGICVKQVPFVNWHLSLETVHFLLPKGSWWSIWHYKNSECPFQSCSAFGEGTSPRSTGQNPPKCCIL